MAVDQIRMKEMTTIIMVGEEMEEAEVEEIEKMMTIHGQCQCQMMMKATVVEKMTIHRCQSCLTVKKISNLLIAKKMLILLIKKKMSTLNRYLRLIMEVDAEVEAEETIHGPCQCQITRKAMEMEKMTIQ